MSKKRKRILKIFIVIFLVLILILGFDFFHKFMLTSKIKKYESNNPPMFSWIDDDGHYSFYKKLYPVALKYDIPMASAIIASRDHENNPTFYNIKQAK